MISIVKICARRCDSHLLQSYGITLARLKSDVTFIYSNLLQATPDSGHKTLLTYQSTGDGLAAWAEFKVLFDNDGSDELRKETLESLISQPFNVHNEGGIATCLDNFQAYMAELEMLVPQEYSDHRKKRTLLASLKNIDSVDHLVQNCKDDSTKTYEACATYLRKNALLIDHK